MTEAQPKAQRWTCVDCAMVASYTPPKSGPPPSGWLEGSRGWLCLTCRREEVIAAVPMTHDAEARLARRSALIEFELIRDPAASDGQIAQRAHTATRIVRPVREELTAAGRLKN